MSASNREFYNIAEWLFDRESWLRRTLQHGLPAVVRESTRIKAAHKELEELGYQFEPPFAEDGRSCLVK